MKINSRINLIRNVIKDIIENKAGKTIENIKSNKKNRTKRIRININKRIAKRVTALMLTISLLPVGDYVQLISSYYAAEVTDENTGYADDGISSDNQLENAENAENTENTENTENAENIENAALQSLVIDEDYTLTENLEVSELLQQSGTLDLNGYKLTVHKDYTQTAGTLKFNGGSLVCYGNYNCESKAVVTMNNANDYLYVEGSIYWNNYENTISNGIIELKGSFNAAITAGFKATGYNKVVFLGNSEQIINISGNANFNIIELKNYSDSGVKAIGGFNYNSIIRNDCRLTVGSVTPSYGMTLEEDMVIEEGYYLAAGAIDLNGYSLTIKGDLIQSSGEVCVNGGSLIIEGDYLIQTLSMDEENTASLSSGVLNMTSENDYVLVQGSFINDSSKDMTGYLTKGILEIQGDFLVNNTYSDYSFVATENHKVVLSGGNKQNIQISSGGINSSRLAKLEIRNESEEGVEFLGNVFILEEINDNRNKVAGTIIIGTDTKFYDNYYGGNVRAASSISVTDEVTIGGDFYSSSNIDLYGTLNIKGNFVYKTSEKNINFENGKLIIYGNMSFYSDTHGEMRMTHTDDYVCVYGDVLYEGGRFCYMSAGTFEIKGDLTSKMGLKATGTHRFLFSGDEKQNISLNNGDYFAILELANYSEEGVYSEKTIQKSQLIRNNCRLRYGDLEGEFGFTLSEDMIYDGDFILIDDVLDLNGHELIIKGDLIQVSGEICVNGGKLKVEGSYHMQSRTEEEETSTYGKSSGIIKMTNSADYVLIEGDFVSDTSKTTTNCLTNGTFEVQGDFTVNNTYSNYSFVSTDNHTVVLSGNKKQTVSITGGNINYSRIANLEIRNESEDGIEFLGYVYISDCVNDNKNKVSGKIITGTNTKFYDNYYGGSISVVTGITVTEELIIGGDFYSSAYIKISGELNVKGNFVFNSTSNKVTLENGRLIVWENMSFNSTSGGEIQMTHEEDYVCVYGNVSYYVVNAFNMSAGTFEIKGSETS